MATTLPGEVVRLAGRAMRLVRTDGDDPPVVLLGGCGAGFYLWDRVVEQLAGTAVLRLDRPGMSGTPWPGTVPALREEVDSIAALLDTLAAPAVLVGHSMAGPHVEAVARLHPDRVAGLVLADSSVEHLGSRPPGTGPWLRLATVAGGVMQVRPLRPIGSLADRVVTSSQSDERRLFSRIPAVERRVYRDPDAAAMVIAENGAYRSQLWDLMLLRQHAPWPGVPTVLLTCAAGAGDEPVRAQRKLAERLGGRQVLVPDSRHLIMLDRPDLVADAVREVRRTR